ncbi:unnamed protein product [Linum trigynum]|uniref:Uncharacterized protein n=1 Tax=Linum trigynum TaxID=586398 RepID=A0AAV2E574_9ROSI
MIACLEELRAKLERRVTRRRATSSHPESTTKDSSTPAVVEDAHTDAELAPTTMEISSIDAAPQLASTTDVPSIFITIIEVQPLLTSTAAATVPITKPSTPLGAADIEVPTATEARFTATPTVVPRDFSESTWRWKAEMDRLLAKLASFDGNDDEDDWWDEEVPVVATKALQLTKTENTTAAAFHTTSPSSLVVSPPAEQEMEVSAVVLAGITKSDSAGSYETQHDNEQKEDELWLGAIKGRGVAAPSPIASPTSAQLKEQLFFVEGRDAIPNQFLGKDSTVSSAAASPSATLAVKKSATAADRTRLRFQTALLSIVTVGSRDHTERESNQPGNGAADAPKQTTFYPPCSSQRHRRWWEESRNCSC